ncbi:uncharacterized protein LACBIDRAFT_312432 [Laccaria bicolor S238N-H82]|uniref:Predicted protein n=1 Tax=Laccaria bicolor (strain S238N-H82 / ATCC MYA-4686) TaxID=486041 RepID=B0DW54_LACBS|nr:uncharacterized protein LACBIDRAFT_312432 [Laccaria bicolor S238N-H82]EDR01123.1 predicted protein [Laccaria bicolor S238N-H82]|eukprot:XP_001888165.1 predicted protein [Laccaria bicolor S238N-H82]
MDKLDSALLKSRDPRTTFIFDKRCPLEELMHLNPHCPLRKGIIYYCRKNTIFEHNIRSSSKREPRIVARNQFKATSFQDLTTVNDTEHLSDAVLSLGVRGSRYFEFIPINGNRMLLFARNSFSGITGDFKAQYCLHLSIHEICSYRFGPALWTYHGDGHSSIPGLHWMKSNTNTLGITFGLSSRDHMELFDIDIEGDYPLIEVGRMNYADGAMFVTQSPDRNILLSVAGQLGAEKINIFYSDSGDANNKDFSFVTNVSIPKLANAYGQLPPMGPPVVVLEFSADGSKFAMATSDGVMSVYDVRSQIPLLVLAVEKQRFVNEPITFLKFSKGILGREVLVFMENALLHKIIHVIDATSFATVTTEIFVLPIDYSYSRRQEESAALFLDPRGESLYVLLDGILYEWEMRKNDDSEWWIGE